MEGLGNSLRFRGSWPWVQSLGRPAAYALAPIPGLVPHCAGGLDLTPLWGREDRAKDANIGVESGCSCSCLPPGATCSGHHSCGARGFSGSESHSVPYKLETWHTLSSLSDSESLSGKCPQVSGAVLVLGMQQRAELDLWSRS